MTKIFLQAVFCCVLFVSSFQASSASVPRDKDGYPLAQEPSVLAEISFGPKWLLTLDPEVRDFFSFRFSMHHEVRSDAELTYGLTGSFDAKFSGGEILGTLGANYFFLDHDITPYMGFDFGAGVMTVMQKEERIWPFGFTGSARVGARFFRGSAHQLDLALTNDFFFRGISGELPIFLGVKLGLLL